MKVESDAPASGVPTPAAPSGDGSRSGARLLGLVVVGVLAVGVVFRFLTTSDLWLDEALTVNIAQVPLSDLVDALKRDGAPPLYYVLLHGWTQLFGTSDVAVRALSGVLGLLMLPLAYFAGRRLGGKDADRARWIGWTSVLVVASSPYAIRYSTETRMYMLTMVLVLLGYLLIWRAVEKPTLGPLAGLALVTAALLYTQYWAFFLLGALGVALLAVLWLARGDEGRERRRTTWRIIGALVVGGVLFVPWLPTFVYQMQHTGTPWDTPVSPPTNAALGVIDFAGGRMIEGWTLVLPLVLLALLALTGRAVDRFRVDVDLRTVPGVRWEWFVGTATLIGGLVLSFLGGTGFQSRYAAVMFPLFVLAVAYGVTVFADRRVRYGIVAFLVVVGFVGGARNVVTNRTQASQVADHVTAEAKAGDVVVYCPDQLGPDVSRLLTGMPRVQQVVFPTFDGPRFVDWVDYEDRNAAANPEAFADEVLRRADGGTIWAVWSAGYRTFDDKCERILARIGADRPQGASLVVADDGIYEFMSLNRFDP
jgi:hypothetical protein